ncbi:hypothetical protein PENCOP_c008G00605 [Penicillium coprophilum]|uniref:Uncharacterized protein n=1 Tax=Penicillium coprophilum TaxID=36646 RepID=A0A1V6UJ53_9EURO|nr:hypothetical protein PENCOP_c008G00605 [Penicillium coprophilum]
MQSSKQPSEVTANKIFRPVTPPQQTSMKWELGNVPVAPGFHKADEDEQLDAFTSEFPITPKATKLLSAFSPKKKPPQSQLSDSSTYDSASSDDCTTDECELIEVMT